MKADEDSTIEGNENENDFNDESDSSVNTAINRKAPADDGKRRMSTRI
jgi:hypothetical protein